MMGRRIIARQYDISPLGQERPSWIFNVSATQVPTPNLLSVRERILQWSLIEAFKAPNHNIYSAFINQFMRVCPITPPPTPVFTFSTFINGFQRCIALLRQRFLMFWNALFKYF